jgi:hypothetical protein
MDMDETRKVNFLMDKDFYDRLIVEKHKRSMVLKKEISLSDLIREALEEKFNK